MTDLGSLVGGINGVLGVGAGPTGAPSGLISGDLRQLVRRVLLATSITAEVAQEAVAAGADLLLALSAPEPFTLIGDRGAGARVLIGADIALHTVSEAAPALMAAACAHALDLSGGEPILTLPTADYAVLIVYTPEENAEDLRRALAAAGAGHIGDYQGCAWSVTGTGEFTPLAGANPTIGQVGAHEQVRERRLEMVVPHAKIPAVTAALRRSHPYEEPAFSFLATHPAPARSGVGRIGDLAEPAPVTEVARVLRQELPGASTRFANDAGPVRRVGITAHATPELITAAARAGAELLVGADLTSTDLAAAYEAGLALVDLPRGAMQWAALPLLARQLGPALPEEVETIVSTRQAPTWQS